MLWYKLSNVTVIVHTLHKLMLILIKDISELVNISMDGHPKIHRFIRLTCASAHFALTASFMPGRMLRRCHQVKCS